MVRNIDIVGKLIKIGNSLGFTIDKKTIKYMNLKEGELVKITITKEDIKKKD